MVHGRQLGKGLTLPELQSGHDAVFLALGLQGGRLVEARLPGCLLIGSHRAISRQRGKRHGKQEDQAGSHW